MARKSDDGESEAPTDPGAPAVESAADEQTDGTDEPDAPEDGALPEIGRRDYMRSVAAAAAMGALGTAATDSAAAETADTSKTVDERIQEHRTGDLEVVVENTDGSPVSDADVSVSQREHEFSFGTAVNADRLINQSSPGDNYRQYIPELFNTAVLGNQHKWRFWENDQQLADEATNWLLDQGLDMRGHVCLWGRDDVWAIPSDVQTAIDERDAETIRDRSMAHIEEIITHYGDDITDWDVVNEAMHAYQLQIGVYGDQIDTEEPWTGEVVPWTSDLLADWYSQAASVIDDNDLDVGVAVNDFNQFPYSYTDGRYEAEIDHINENGAQLDTVGLQAHVAARQGEFNTNSDPDGRIDADQVVSEINTWADHGARVKITEFDTYNGDDWNSDQERADVTENYLRGAFSHPGVDAFVMWGFWDGDHWQDEAPLFYDDWSQKPAYDVWTGLVYDEWWTDTSGTTDDSGTYATTAFLGEHEITVSTDSDSATTTTSVTDAAGTTTVTVTVEGDGGGSGDTQPPTTPENLSVTSTTASTVTVSWDASTDNGSSGLDHYAVSVDGSEDQTVGAGMTTATIDGLSAETAYQIAVSAVDGAGNESDAATVEATTDQSDDQNGDGSDGDGGESDDALVVHEFDGDAYPGSNDLGNWAGAGSFANGDGSGAVADGALRLEYDNAGWFASNVGQSVADRPVLHLRVRGDAGGEESQFRLKVGGVDDLLANLTDDAVGTEWSTVSVDLAANGADLDQPNSVRFNFWEGHAGAVDIDRIAFEAADSSGGANSDLAGGTDADPAPEGVSDTSP
ncbi:endo-1,4-beta-xylanase [Halosimplex sp. TS25]|uniref:endo-1,4-beta-xylanase n=1 Tax=Halosimplex rarum TaxID=3396619 RepID=UPI0039E7F168